MMIKEITAIIESFSRIKMPNEIGILNNIDVTAESRRGVKFFAWNINKNIRNLIKL